MNDITRMMEAKRQLRAYKEKEERSYPWLAKKIGISQSTLHKFITEDGRTMKLDNLLLVEEFLDREGVE